MDTPARNLTVGLLLLIVLAGCNYTYRAKTVLHSDGSVDREIYQPAGEGADEGPRAAGWAKVEREKPAVAAGGAGAVAGGRTTIPLTKEVRYFTASGHFPSADRIPNHFVTGWDGAKFELPPDLPRGHLIRRAARLDLVFVTRHDWVETLTDGVTYQGVRQAREELADLAIAVGRDVVDEAIGKEYDAAGLEQWARAEGKAWLAELTDFAFVQVLAIKQRPAVPGRGEPVRELLDGFADICASHGLTLKRGGRFLKDKDLDRAVAEFLTDLACRTIRTRADGKPVDRQTARGWVESLGGREAKAAGADDGDAPEPNPFKAAAERVITAKYGGPDALKKRMAPLVIRLAGWYWPDVMSHRQFDYTMTVPGEVVRTNAELLEANRVRWEFDARLAWPFGFDMACQSLEIHSKVQQDLLDGKPLATREAAIEYVALFEGRPSPLDLPDEKAAAPAERPPDPLLAALRECRDRTSLTPLYDYRDREARAARTDAQGSDLRRTERLFELLKLPEKPPAE